MEGLPKYMLMTTPKLEQEFIICTKTPIIVGQVVFGDVEEMIREHQPFAVGKPYEQNEWAVFGVGKLDDANFDGTTQEQADAMAKVLREMSDFYNENYMLGGDDED